MFNHLIHTITNTLGATFHHGSEPKRIDASCTEQAYVRRVVHAADGASAPDFTPTDGSLGYGTCHHPSLLRQTRMAEELEGFLRQLMG